ncbi:DUF2283 domain-containing protein [Pectobacterium versatile]|uniref:DUF2283 domain-containing protein n=1 Tax=Pectobacterium versatile TaxID=2488639 RepID=UPI000CDF24B6|nr:DUF2283 domain-containing protein [Pectobacterium versatile]MBQ4769777.1 DUF2283 domain-containing protein [Pectobacterium versatile]POY52282.1 hypothetical protein F018LOC_04306 [Pectobacterium versatile]POY55836.1 hypothetical protein PB70LOC_04263 [Pectobacterium versatile]POY61039.1 hypothetical protein PB69LOC_04225 [Pectobacterium versatile]PRI17563.1 DUF2283 domain-containing protein [Pectobacterium versatile]
MRKNRINLEISDDSDMAYLFLPSHPGKGKAGVTVKQVALQSIMENYQGPEIYLDFDSDGNIIGMEFFLD